MIDVSPESELTARRDGNQRKTVFALSDQWGRLPGNAEGERAGGASAVGYGSVPIIRFRSFATDLKFKRPPDGLSFSRQGYDDGLWKVGCRPKLASA